MRFMVLMIPGNRSDNEAGVMPDAKVIEPMMHYNQQLASAGILLAGEGLHPTSKGARVSCCAGQRTIADGPFTEAKEIIGGFWMWQVKSRHEALEWAKRCPLQEGDTLELRQVFEAADFGPEVAAQEAALMEQIGQRLQQHTKARV